MKKTGRIFKCIGLKEDEGVAWSNYFEIGKEYKEYTHPLNDPKALYLFDGDIDYCTWRVDKSQFELIEP